MRTILLGLCALTLFAGLTPKTAAQTVTTTLGAPTVDLDWFGVTNISVGFGTDRNFKAIMKGTRFSKSTF